MERVVVLGRPGVGKTTLVRKVAEAFPGCFRGFYTAEIRKGKERTGFGIKTLSGKEGILAERGRRSPLQVGRYGVLLEDLETIGVREIEEALRSGIPLLLDEVGKMELLSPLFREWFFRAWSESSFVLVTSCFPPLREVRDLWENEGVRKFVLDRGNREELGREIMDLVRTLLRL
ncbi:MAG: nucleoside-triphosphatase [Candidatus Caldatribacteriaceae bacterium]